MTTMSQRNKKIMTRKIPATNNKALVCTDSLHFTQEMLVTNYKILVSTSTCMQDSWIY